MGTYSYDYLPSYSYYPAVAGLEFLETALAVIARAKRRRSKRRRNKHEEEHEHEEEHVQERNHWHG